jgi:hypothetical protein
MTELLQVLAALFLGGGVRGTVWFDGAPPRMEELKRSSDPFCAGKRMVNPEVVIHDGKLANVLVHVLGAPKAPPPPQPAIIEQVDCMYRPRVSGVVFGQKIEIVNRDPTLHNLHSYAGTQTWHGDAQVPGVQRMMRQPPNTMMKLKCDVHQWMTGYLWVQDNSYFAVTGDDGSFGIKQLPPGTYDIEAWHERFGFRRGVVTVLPFGAANFDFHY